MSVMDVLNDKVAQELLNSPELAKLAYNRTDGTPRVVPIWFHWDGRPEYALAAECYFGPEQGRAWAQHAAGLLKDWVRVAVTPKEARVIDFETRWPSAITKATAAQG